MKKILFVYVLAFAIGLMYDYQNLVPRVFHVYCLEAYMYKEKREVIDQGNVLAYKKIVASMKDSAWISPAYYDVYHSLMTVMDEKGTPSEDTKQLAMAFLRRGAALNEERCKKTLAAMH